MRSKLKFIVPLLLLAVGGVYKFVLAPEPAPATKHKVEGEVYILPREFLVNLSGERFAKLNVALVLEHGQLAAGGDGAAVEPPEGFGPLPQEAVVRDLVTDKLTDVDPRDLISRSGREELKHEIATAISKKTDVKVHDVLFTDVAVQ